MAFKELRLASFAQALRPALVAVLVVTLVFVVLLGLRVQTALQSLHEVPTDNVNWNLTQLELDLVRFVSEIHILRVDKTEPLSELRKRYDLFYSRAQSAITGKGFTGAELADLSEPLSQRLKGFLDKTTPSIDADDAVLRMALVPMEVETGILREDLRRMSIDIIERQASLADQRRADFANLVQRTALASAASVGLLLMLLALVVWLNRRAAAEARQTARISDRLAATVDSALDAIIIADSNGQILQFNPSAEAIFGFAQGEAIGQDLGHLIVPHDMRSAHFGGMAKMKKTGQMKVVNSGRFEIKALRKSGEVFPVELSISSARGDKGQIFIAYLRDISAQLAAKAALTTARDEALAAEKAKTNFLAVMSHEMRTPLNGVLASLEIAAKQTTDLKAAHFITLARQSAGQLLRHANDVLDITRTEAGGLQLASDEFLLDELLSNLVEAQRPVAAAKALDLTLHALEALPPFLGDPFRIGQIIQNFLSNAIKFTKTGSVTVEYDVHETLPDRLVIEMRVIDTGTGIAEDDQARVFDDFVMLDPSFQRSGGGAGLGLAISRRLALAMGGEIGVESEPGDGSCFWLRLPLTIAGHTPQTAARTQPAVAVPKLDVLVVEDNATNRAVLEEMLLNLGQTVTMAHDGAQGMQMARAHQFDLILMDISMPEMDGITATGLIRAEGASRQSRIIAVTAHSMPADQARFRAAGMDGTLVKPISSDALSRILTGQSASETATIRSILDGDRIADLGQTMGPTAMARILRSFLTEGGVLNARIQAALLAGDDAPTLMALCHEAAGACAVMGAARMRAHFAEAETHCRNGDISAAHALLSADTQPLWAATSAAIADVLTATSRPYPQG
jgi:PAS domain S-box-containing protein